VDKHLGDAASGRYSVRGLRASQATDMAHMTRRTHITRQRSDLPQCIDRGTPRRRPSSFWPCAGSSTPSSTGPRPAIPPPRSTRCTRRSRTSPRPSASATAAAAPSTARGKTCVRAVAPPQPSVARAESLCGRECYIVTFATTRAGQRASYPAGHVEPTRRRGCPSLRGQRWLAALCTPRRQAVSPDDPGTFDTMGHARAPQPAYVRGRPCRVAGGGSVREGDR